MRLIDTKTWVMKEFMGRHIPQYAILSHTCEQEEVTLQEWKKLWIRRKKGFRAAGIPYVWVDACCIDKSKELGAFRSDQLDVAEPKAVLRNCRWYTRGWTLQELIAPKVVHFYDMNRRYGGQKNDLIGVIADITSVRPLVLRGLVTHLQAYVAERMYWAAGRETTREEDMTYCLLEIHVFSINMPMICGEGIKAFRRLQEGIIMSSYVVSVFGWERPYNPASAFSSIRIPIVNRS